MEKLYHIQNTKSRDKTQKKIICNQV